jgi:hypothetical protein
MPEPTIIDRDCFDGGVRDNIASRRRYDETQKEERTPLYDIFLGLLDMIRASPEMKLRVAADYAELRGKILEEGDCWAGFIERRTKLRRAAHSRIALCPGYM